MCFQPRKLFVADTQFSQNFPVVLSQQRRMAAHLLGEHNREVLAELGIGDEELARLEAQGAFAS